MSKENRQSNQIQLRISIFQKSSNKTTVLKALGAHTLTMSLRSILGKGPSVTSKIAFIDFEECNIVDSNDQPYYIGKLATPYKVRCSVDKDIEPHEVDEVLVRAAVVDSDDYPWVPINPEKPEEGAYIKDWVIDFSKGHRMAIYQEETIAKWARATRKERTSGTRSSINDGIRAKLDAAKKANQKPDGQEPPTDGK